MRDLLRNSAYLLAAIPAFFLPVAYLIMIGWLVVYGLPAVYRGDAMPEPQSWFYTASWYGFHALMIQWPIYLIWALITRRLTWRLKWLWSGILLIFSVFGIPWFLSAMYRYAEAEDPIRLMRNRAARRFFAKGIVRVMPPPVHLHSDLPVEYRQVRFRCSKQTVPEEFYVVTAWNPQGVRTEIPANLIADEHLRSEIERAGMHPFPVTGGSADFEHAEPGYGIVCQRNEALLLARRFRQQAFYEVAEGQVYLVSVLDGHLPGDYIGAWADLVTVEADHHPAPDRKAESDDLGVPS